MKLADLFIKLGLNKTEYEKGLNDAKKQTSSFGNAVDKIAGMVAGIFAVDAITNFISNIINIRKEFEKYEAVLTNTLGSNQAARQEMKMLQDIAAQTPFSLSELTASYIKLVNYGLKPTREQIIKMGDLASSTGKGFNQLVEAVADAVTGQYERLKEFGIKASQAGDKVTFTFKEQKTTVDNNAASIKAYLVSLGDLQGVSGSMAAISATLGGKISNLGDSWDSLLNTLGKGTSGIMFTVISWLNSFVSMLDSAYRSIEDIKKAVGDTATANAMQSALGEIATIEQSLIANGVNAIDAHKRAIELYVSSVDNRIKELNKSRKEGTYELKQQLIDEKNAVLNHFKELDDQKKKSSEVDVKTAVEQLAAIRKVNDELEAQRILRKEFYGEKMKPITPLYQGAGDLMLPQKGTETLGVFGSLDSHYKTISENRKKWTDEELQSWKEFTDELNETLSSGISEIIVTGASLFGEMAALGDWDWKDFGNKILDSIGKFMQTFGALMISMGVSMLKIDLGMSTWNPALLIGGGVALVAAGAAVSALASGGVSKSSTAASTSASGYTNYNASSGAATLNGNVVFQLEGTTLKGVLDNTNRKNNLIR